MKTLILWTVGLALLAFSLPVQAQGRGGVMMKALDADGDGKLSAKEIANAVTALRYLDDDGDGVLSKRELGFRSRFGGMGDMGDYGDFGNWGGRGRRGGRGSKAGEGKLLKPAEVEFKDGTDTIHDRKTFKALTYKQVSEKLFETAQVVKAFIHDRQCNYCVYQVGIYIDVGHNAQ